jgi:hypothetical protein
MEALIEKLNAQNSLIKELYGKDGLAAWTEAKAVIRQHEAEQRGCPPGCDIKEPHGHGRAIVHKEVVQLSAGGPGVSEQPDGCSGVYSLQPTDGSLPGDFLVKDGLKVALIFPGCSNDRGGEATRICDALNAAPMRESGEEWRWLPGNFPESGRVVLVTQRANANPFTAFMDDCGNWYSPRGKTQHLNIIAWMPMPHAATNWTEKEEL